MKSLRFAAALGATVFVVACGGGDEGSTPATPAVPTVNVTLSPESQSVTGMEDAAETSMQFVATASSTPSTPVVADVEYDTTLFAIPDGIVANGNSYSVTLKTAADLLPGTYTGTVRFRLCKEAACNTVYPGSTKSFSYTVDVLLKDWVTFQRNAGHTGYVRAKIDAAKIAKAWEWAPAYSNSLSTIASQGSRIFVSRSNQDSTSTVAALDSTTGSVTWQQNLGSVHSFSPPAVGPGRVYVQTMITSSDINKHVIFDADTGTLRNTINFDAQWSEFQAPTPWGENFYTVGGYYGNVAYGYDGTRAVNIWRTSGTGKDIWNNETPAVDDKYVYYYNGPVLDVFDRRTGAHVKAVPDPLYAWGGYSGRGGPMITAPNRVVSFSGSYTGNSYSQPKPLTSFAIDSGTNAWRSSDVYETMPATAKGVIYIARNKPARVDALDEATGAILWSWTPPVDEEFVGNTIVTENLVFVSTNAKLYALSLDAADHAPVWSVATPGRIAITRDYTLVVKHDEDGAPALIAYRLR